MSLTRTTLSAALGAGDTEMYVASTSGFPAPGTNSANLLCRVDAEDLVVTGQTTAGVVQLRGRGSNGTLAAAHASGATVYLGASPQDFELTPPTTIGDFLLPASAASRGASGILRGTAEPISGTGFTATGLGVAQNGALYLDANRKVLYYNETNASSPYWTPLGTTDHPNLLAWYCDFADGVGKALANTDAVAIVPGSGVRIFGQGIAETDSGVVVTFGEAGPQARLTTTDEDAHLVALTFGAVDGGNLPMQPNREGPMVLEVTCKQVTALTLRRFFVGFLGLVSDALDPPVTGATTTITLVQDDLAGLYFDAGLTAATSIFAPYNNNDAAASLTTTQAALSVATEVAAAGTSQKFRVEIDRSGTMYAFIDRVLVATVPSAVDITEEFAPVVLIGSTSAAVKSMDVSRMITWCRRS